MWFPVFKRIILTHTIQPRSLAFLNERGRGSAINNPETEDDIRLLLPVIESLNKLSEALNRLDYALRRQETELNIYCEYTGEKKRKNEDYFRGG